MTPEDGEYSQMLMRPNYDNEAHTYIMISGDHDARGRRVFSDAMRPNYDNETQTYIMISGDHDTRGRRVFANDAQRDALARRLLSPGHDPKSAVITQVYCGNYSSFMFRSQRYGVTWKPEVITRQLRGLIGPADHGILCVATDGVWVRRRDIAEI